MLPLTMKVSPRSAAAPKTIVFVRQNSIRLIPVDIWRRRTTRSARAGDDFVNGPRVGVDRPRPSRIDPREHGAAPTVAGVHTHDEASAPPYARPAVLDWVGEPVATLA